MTSFHKMRNHAVRRRIESAETISNLGEVMLCPGRQIAELSAADQLKPDKVRFQPYGARGHFAKTEGKGRGPKVCAQT